MTRSYEKLLVVPIIILLLCSASIVGVGYSSLSSEVINSGNFVSFVRVNNPVEPTGPSSDLIVPPEPGTINVGGVDYPTYDIEFEDTPGLLTRTPIDLDLEGAFCFHLKTGIFSFGGTFIINGYSYDIPWNVNSYYTLIDTDNNPATKPVLTKKTLPQIIGDNLWITTNSTSTFTFSGFDTYDNDFLSFVFKE